VQPDTHDPYFGTYVVNYPLPIEIFVGWFLAPRKLPGRARSTVVRTKRPGNGRDL